MKIISPPPFASLLFCDDKCDPCIGAHVPFKTSEYTMESQRSRQRISLSRQRRNATECLITLNNTLGLLVRVTFASEAHIHISLRRCCVYSRRRLL